MEIGCESIAFTKKMMKKLETGRVRAHLLVQSRIARQTPAKNFQSRVGRVSPAAAF
jgi:hypothetical protein